MSGYGGMSTSNSKNQSMSQGNFDQNVWSGMIPFLQQMYGSAQNQFTNSQGAYGRQMKGAVKQNNQVMGMANQALGGQMAGGAYSGIDANKLQDQIYSSMQGPTATQEINNMIMGGKGNNYADAMKGQYVQDANIASQNMLNNLDARGSASGLPGSSRSALAQGVGLQGINQNLQRNLAETGFNTFDQDLNRKLQIAGQADQSNLARQEMLSGMLANKQGAMSGGMMFAPNIGQMGGFNTGQASGMMGLLQGLKGVIGDPTILNSGSNFGSSLGRSNSFGMSGGGGIGGGGGSGGGGMCFITTAATHSLGEPDDGPTLTKLRMFRDNFMLADPALVREVAKYYDIAPKIVEKINARPDSSLVYEFINDTYLQPAVNAIDEGDNEEAYDIYKDMVEYCLDLVGE